MCPTVSSCRVSRVSGFLPEALDVFRAFLELHGSAALHQFADLFDDVGIRQRRNVAGVHAILNRSKNAPHNFSRARLRHVRNQMDVLRPRDFADHRFDRGCDFVLDRLLRQNPGLQRNVDDWNAALDFIHSGNHGRFGDFRNREAGGLDFLGAEAVAGHVDDVVHAAKDAVVAVSGNYRAIRGVVRPILPLLALGVPTILRVILTGETVGVAPNRLHDAGPGITDANVSRGVGASFDFLSILVPDDWVNSQHRRARAAGLHGIEGRLRRAEEPASFGLPPGVHNYRFAFANDVVIPLPDFRLDGFADGGHMLEMVVVLFGLVGTGFAQHANGRGRSVENVDVEALRDTPRAANVRELRHAFVEDTGSCKRERAVNDVRVSGDPADVGHAPVDVFGMNVLVILGGASDVREVTASAMLAALWLARGPAGVHEKQRGLRILRNGLNSLTAIVLQNVVNEIVAIHNHRRV